MIITVSNRQSLLDIAVIALGSVAGVFALAKRNNLPVTAVLDDGQTIVYELEDVVSNTIRNAYATQRISPATDIDNAEYRELLYATGTKRPSIIKPPIINLGDDNLNINKVDEVLGLIANDQPVLVQSKQQLTRIMADPFSEVFS